MMPEFTMETSPEEQADEYAGLAATENGYGPRMEKRIRGAWLKGYRGEGSSMKYCNLDRPLRWAWDAGHEAGRVCLPCDPAD